MTPSFARLSRAAKGTRAPSEIDLITSSAFVWSLARPPIRDAPGVVISEAPAEADDAALVSRVRAAYRAAMVGFDQSSSFWDTTFGQLKRPIREALMASDAEKVTAVLRNPSANTHFWGFDAICAAPPGMTEPHELVLRNLNGQVEWRKLYARWLHDGLVSLAEAVGCHRTFYPETTPSYH